MKLAVFGRYALVCSVVMLAGCGGSQPPIAQPGAMLQSRAIEGQPDRRGWMRPGAKRQDLVYATGGCGGVCILTYPDGKLKASISLPFPVGGDCSDSEGKVFVTNDAQVFEYAHGGTTPMATLALPGVNASACGVDPKTGNLAVVFGGGSAGNIAIFADASSAPTLYSAGIGPQYCGYDDQGNLFVSGSTNGVNAFAELLYGNAEFKTLSLEGNTGGPGQVQWDGSYITLENQSDRNIRISRLKVSGSAVRVVAATRLRGPKWATQSWIAGNRVILPYSAQGNVTYKISVWRYPQGGKAVVKFNFSQSKFTRFLGVTLSKA